MPSLKDLKVRINSVKSTQKITAAMKMVAAAKLRRAQEQAEAARPYAERMDRMLGSLATAMAGRDGAPALLVGTGKDQTHLIVVMTSDRGLCGGFNSTIVRGARKMIRELLTAGKTVKIICVGRKGRDQLKRDFGKLIIESFDDVGRPRLSYADADRIAHRITALYEAGEFDVCTIFYNKFKSAMTQFVTQTQLIPFSVPGTAGRFASPGFPPSSFSRSVRMRVTRSRSFSHRACSSAIRVSAVVRCVAIVASRSL
jgi:F-type H+-transporting ATPase subunit gamma